VEAVREKEVKLRGVGFVKEVSFKLGTERERELKMYRVVNQKSQK